MGHRWTRMNADKNLVFHPCPSVCIRGLIFFAAAGFAFGGPPERTVIDQYCVGCHNTKAKIGGLALDTLNADNPTQNPEAWEKVIRKLRVRYMPPLGLPRPDEKTYNSLVSSLESALDRAQPDPGRTDT